MYQTLKNILLNNTSPEVARLLRTSRDNLLATLRRCRFRQADVPLMGYSLDGYPDVYNRTALYWGSDLYGLEQMINRYAHHKDRIKGCIEHGVYFGNNVMDINLTAYSKLPCIITYGQYRKNVLREHTDRPVLTIGSYIKYAPRLLSDDSLSMIKKQLGKVLLVLPAHGIKGINTEYDQNLFIKKINNFSNAMNFDTVVVCLYYSDVLQGRANHYEKNGYIVVSAGHAMNPVFLSRLRSYFEIADMSISNTVGTHVGYSIALNTPHYIDGGNVKYVGGANDFNRKAPAFGTYESVMQMGEVRRAFTNPEMRITNEQKKIVDYFWGLENFKSPNQIFSILEACDALYERTKHLRRINWAKQIDELDTKYREKLQKLILS